MELKVDFPGLDAALKSMGASEGQLRSIHELDPLDPTEVELLETGGIDVSIEDVDQTGPGILSYRGRQVLLYIQDHGTSLSQAIQDGSTGNKFHVTDCSVLQGMRRQGRFERYVVTNRLDGKFYISGQASYWSGPTEGEAELRVCQVCLKHLNYKGVRQRGRAREASEQFSIAEFFERYGSFFPFKPKRTAGNSTLDRYAKNWSEISENERAKVNYVCQECHVDLSDLRRLLHVHHIDGNKGNNDTRNLRVLCAACHKHQPKHGALNLTHGDMQAITRARQASNILNDPDWDEALEFCDSGIADAIQLLRREGIAPPDIGVDVQDANSKVVGTLEAAWSNLKVGIAISKEEADSIRAAGWELLELSDLVTNPQMCIARSRLRQNSWIR